MKRILVIGEVFDVPSPALTLLDRLDQRWRLELVKLAPDFSRPEVAREDIRAEAKFCNALITRPTRAGEITDDMLEDVETPFWVATLSKGTDKIKVSRDGIHIIKSEGSGNAAAVAELAHTLVNLLLRPVHEGIQTTLRGEFGNKLFRGAARIAGRTWVCVGSGNQARELLKRICPCGVSRVIIYNPQIDAVRLTSCVAGMQTAVVSLSGSGNWGAKAAYAETEVEVLGTDDLDWALSQADIVTLHLPLKEETHGPH